MTAPTQTRDPLPDGVTSATIGTCPTCGPQTIVFNDCDEPRITRSTQPGPDGQYVAHGHAEWCPIWCTSEPVTHPAPCCGARIDGFTDRQHGVWLVLPGVMPDTENPVLEADAAPWQLAAATRRIPAPEFDRLTLIPCGHRLEGDKVHEAIAQLRQRVADIDHERAERALAEHADLLTRAEQAGYGALVDQYRAAVHASADTAAGLLAAIRTIVGNQP